MLTHTYFCPSPANTDRSFLEYCRINPFIQFLVQNQIMTSIHSHQLSFRYEHPRQTMLCSSIARLTLTFPEVLLHNNIHVGQPVKADMFMKIIFLFTFPKFHHPLHTNGGNPDVLNYWTTCCKQWHYTYKKYQVSKSVELCGIDDSPKHILFYEHSYFWHICLAPMQTACF